ncbi:MAG TPA: hypothetical protein DIU45_02015 [Clostridium sp.]|nr:hypothetical protein [Clostridium sp.]
MNFEFSSFSGDYGKKRPPLVKIEKKDYFNCELKILVYKRINECQLLFEEFSKDVFKREENNNG